jgi:4-diphosphocytidyl-2-C-methyl-D-erythritol kinase
MVSMQPAAVVMWAPAKVNLFLEVLAKRADGYHEIATLMLAVSLYDTLEFKEEATGRIQLHCDLPTLSVGPDNLVVRAAELLRQHTGVDRGADIRLKKRIPLAAGLAGGSTDAAAALAGLNRLWKLELSQPELADLGAQLGSDVPFFLYTLPAAGGGGEGWVKGSAAWCTGRGEIVTPLPLAAPLHLVLVCPPIGLSTADVYRNVTVPQQPHRGDDLRRKVTEGDVEAIGRLLFNRLQPAAERLCPDIARLYQRIESLHPAGQLMSGSGSSLFALCRDWQEAIRIAHELRRGASMGACPQLFLVRSCV